MLHGINLSAVSLRSDVFLQKATLTSQQEKFWSIHVNAQQWQKKRTLSWFKLKEPAISKRALSNTKMRTKSKLHITDCGLKCSLISYIQFSNFVLFTAGSKLVAHNNHRWSILPVWHAPSFSVLGMRGPYFRCMKNKIKAAAESC